MKTINKLAEEHETFDGLWMFNALDLERFINNILTECVKAIDDKFVPGDLSEHARGLRTAKAAIRRHFQSEAE